MRITDVRVYTPLVGSRPQCLVKVETDVGIHGWGESGLTSREGAVAAAVRHYRSFLVGEDPMRRGQHWQRLYRSQYFEGGRVLLAAQSAIDIALHDLCGKALGVPVYDLLGGRQRDWVPLFASVPLATDSEMPTSLRRLIEAGWDVLRIGLGSSPPGGDPLRFDPRPSLAFTAERIIEARAAVGPAVTLGIDWHHRLSVAETASFCARLPAGTLDFLEEPIRAESVEAYRRLRSLVDVPLAVGEEFSSKWAFAPFIEGGLLDLVRVDVGNVGGLTEAVKVAAMAESHYLDLMPHNPLGPVATAAAAHLCLAVPNVAWLEMRRSPGEDLGFYDERMFPVQAIQDGPCLRVQDLPGLGIEVDEDAVGAPGGDREVPQLRRADGSVQNW